MAVDFVRGALLSVLGAAAGSALLRSLAPLWGVHPRLTGGSLLLAGCAVLAAAVAVFGGWREARRFFLLGAICGSLLLLIR
jgi:hypothetical protein